MCKKKSFFLIEILLAIFLLTLLALPWMSNTLFLLRQDHKQMEEVEYQRIANLSFVEIYEKLLQQEIPWESFSQEARNNQFTLPKTSLQLPEMTPFEIERNFTIKLLKEKQDKEKNVYRKVEVSLVLIKRKEKIGFSKVFAIKKQF